MMRRRKSSLHFLKGSTLTTEELTSIQVELAALDRRLQQLESDEQHGLPFAEGSYEDLMPQDYDTAESQATLVHILGAELCQLAADGDAAAVERLLTKGVDANSQDYDERTPLHLAALNGHLAVVEVLLRFHAKTGISDENGLTPLEVAQRAKHQHIVDAIVPFVGTADESPRYGFCTTPLLDHTSAASTQASSTSDVATSHDGNDDSDASSSSSGSSDSSELLEEKLPTPRSAVTPTGSAPPRNRHDTAQPEETMVIVMVGLPARGKTFVAQNIVRYFAWHGVKSETLAHKDYWKKVTAGLATSAFDEGDPEEETAALIAKGVRNAVRRQQCGLIIVDGTNSTRRRRQCLQHAIEATRCVPADRLIFVEINNSDPTLIAANVQRALEAAKNPPPHFVRDYYDLMKRHEKVYQTMARTHDRESCFIRIDDQQTFHLNRITGFRPTRMVFLLQNLRHSPVTLYFTRPGEYEEMGTRLGGNSPLTELGDAYSRALYEYITSDCGAVSKAFVMSSSSKRATQTVRHFYNMAKFALPPMPEGSDGDEEATSAVSRNTEVSMPSFSAFGAATSEAPPAARAAAAASSTVLPADEGEMEFPRTPVLVATTPTHHVDPHRVFDQQPTSAKKGALGKTSSSFRCRVGIFPHLDDINHGDCEGQLMSDVCRTLPNTVQSMEQDWYNVSWPNGESMRQIFTGRLENLIHELNSSSVPVVVCSHRPLIQGFCAYFTMGDDGAMMEPQDAKTIKLPPHSVVKVAFRGTSRTAEVIDLGPRTVQIFKRRSGQDLHMGKSVDSLDNGSFN